MVAKILSFYYQHNVWRYKYIIHKVAAKTQLSEMYIVQWHIVNLVEIVQELRKASIDQHSQLFSRETEGFHTFLDHTSTDPDGQIHSNLDNCHLSRLICIKLCFMHSDCSSTHSL